MLESAHFYYLVKDYLRSRVRFKIYIDKTNNKNNLPLCWHYFINSSINIVKSMPEEKKQVAKNILIKDLEDYLSQEGVLLSDEIINYNLMLAQIKYELNDAEDALKHLHYIFDKFEVATTRPEINMLMALCYREIEETSLFCFYAEKAIDNDIDQQIDQRSIRLGLYNAYVALDQADHKEEYLMKAAESLFLSISFDSMEKVESDLKNENLMWLAGYYHKKVDAYMAEDWKRELCDDKDINIYASRAILTLEKLLSDVTVSSIQNTQNIYFEQELLKLADMYGFAGDMQAKKVVLGVLIKSYERGGDFKCMENAYFEMALVFQKLKELDQAIVYFSKVIAMNNRSYFNLASNLHLARLSLATIDKKDFKIDNPQVVAELSSLKNIKLQKNLQNEPIHLEAALDYVEMQSKIEDNIDTKLSLLKRVKQDFTQTDDIISNDYQSSKKIYPDKERVLQAYLMFIDAKILQLTAEKQDNVSYLLQAEQLLISLKEKGMVVSSYLDQKLQEIAKEIRSKKENGMTE